VREEHRFYKQHGPFSATEKTCESYSWWIFWTRYKWYHTYHRACECGDVAVTREYCSYYDGNKACKVCGFVKPVDY
jgi:hypothetical protein